MNWVKCFAGAAALVWAGNAHALSYSADLNEVYSGASPLSVQSPWLRATFDDLANGKVRLTMEALHLTGNEFVGSWLFNINPSIQATSLTFALSSSDPGQVSPDAINHNPTGQNYKAGPEKYFDIQFAGQTANSPGRFTSGEKLIYEVGLTSGVLHASDFLFVNQQKVGSSLQADDWYSAAHVQAIGVAGQSAWIGAKVTYANQEPPPGAHGVPDSGPTLLLLAGASAGLIGFARYRGRERRATISHPRDGFSQ